jgi:NAD(P)-dependent dehydrogenase (short-subunit alcohol dehydrogenase family)
MGARGWALITGAARRLGQALAVRAAEAGYDVVVHARSGDVSETVTLVRGRGAKAVALQADLSDPLACAGLVAEAPGPLTLLVNSASVFEDDRLESLDAAGLDAAFATNARAPIMLSQAFAARLPAEREGLIVNMLDQRVLRPDPRFFSYTVSRAALWMATQTMAQALAPRIRVNAIGPGPTLASVHQSEADFAAEARGTLLARPVGAREIVLALGYLIEAQAVTGQMIAVDSGQHLGWRTPDVIGE